MKRTVDECLAAFDQAGIPCSRFRDPAAMLDAHASARGVFAPIKDAAREFRGVNAPWRMSDADTGIGQDIPGVGEHRDAIPARVLGLSATDVGRAADAGAFEKGAA